MEQKIYLLIDHAIDAREILAAFSTREAADAALRFGGAYSTIEEVDMDPQLPVAPDGHSLWNVSVDGSPEPSAIRMPAFDLSELDQVILEVDESMVEVWALNKEHAIHLGMEKIEQYKKEQSGGA